jgi:Kef-type K+ transport system membrane component KefB
MPQLELLVPALGAAGQGHIHGLWWLILAVIVFALVTPLAYLMGRNGGQPQRR